MEINRREILRYLGYKNQAADQETEKRIEDCISKLREASAPKHLYREFPLRLGKDGAVDGTCFKTRSRNLARNLADCGQVIVFAATLGIGADHLLNRYGRLEMSRAVIMQAAAAAMIEAYCDGICRELRDKYQQRDLYLRPRFSPGYGDFPLDCQKELLEALEAGKRIGIKLTDSLLMMPSKSVSAVMGVSPRPHRCAVAGCEACSKTDCMYRRQER